MHIMVTGGAGYIGSVITETLIKKGYRVTVFDNLSRGHRESVPAEAVFVKGDLHDTALLRKTLGAGIDAVIHMAANSLVGDSVIDPAPYYQNNVLGSLQLLDSMRATGVKKIVFSSTAAVYGEPKRTPIEEDDPKDPTNPYGASKLAIEGALKAYQAYGFNSICLRYFNAAGASSKCGELHDPETHLIPIILQAAAGTRDAVTVYGEDYPTPDGTCVRDYIHVLDLAEAHVLALGSVMKKDTGWDVYNIGCGQTGYSVREVLNAAARVTGKPIPIKVGPRREGDPAILVASPEKIKRDLGFSAKHQNLEGIIESAWQWMERHAKTSSAKK